MFMIGQLPRCILDSKGFANVADLVAAGRGGMIAPAAADKAHHIRHFRIAQAPPEVRHGERHRRSLCCWKTAAIPGIRQSPSGLIGQPP